MLVLCRNADDLPAPPQGVPRTYVEASGARAAHVAGLLLPTLANGTCGIDRLSAAGIRPAWYHRPEGRPGLRGIARGGCEERRGSWRTVANHNRPLPGEPQLRTRRAHAPAAPADSGAATRLLLRPRCLFHPGTDSRPAGAVQA